MKQRIHRIFLALAFLISIQVVAQDQDIEVLRIKARVTFEDEPLSDITVELYEGNEIISSEQVKKGGKFKFDLSSNRIYTLELKKDGFYTKRISIVTRIPEDYFDKEEFEFDIGLLPMEEDDVADEGLLDYPSALIGFNSKKEKFYYDVDYDRAFKAEMKAAKTED